MHNYEASSGAASKDSITVAAHEDHIKPTLSDTSEASMKVDIHTRPACNGVMGFANPSRLGVEMLIFMHMHGGRTYYSERLDGVLRFAPECSASFIAVQTA